MRQLRKVLEIGRVNLLRQVRDRGDLFFVFVLPTIIIVALGLQFGGTARARLGVVAPVGDAAAEALVDNLAEDTARFEIRRLADIETLEGQVERGQLEAGLVIPDGFTAVARPAGPGRDPLHRDDRRAHDRPAHAHRRRRRPAGSDHDRGAHLGGGEPGDP